MADKAVTTRAVKATATVRRGVAQPVSPVLINEGWRGVPLGGPPMANTDVQKAFHDTVFGLNSNNAYLSIVDTGYPHYRVMRHSLPGSFYNANDLGVSYQPIFARTTVDHAEMSYWVRFNTNFEWGGGGKLPGFGGNNSKVSVPPAGGIPSPYGFTCRPMWRAAPNFSGAIPNKIELTAYLYLPKLPADTFGIDRHYGVELGDTGGFSDGTWRHVKQVLKMNTSTVSNNNLDPATLVQGTDYQADGLHEVWINGVRVYQKTDEVWRLYNDVHITRMHWSVFRGGGDALWSVGTAGDVDIASLSVRALS